MLPSDQPSLTAVPMERLIALVAAMERDAVVAGLLAFGTDRGAGAGLRLDFTAEYLATLSTERVRHIYLAALLQARRRHADRPAAA